ncbi:MAG TPA: RagB/SusD family nutrient uptake outer membrane protein [Chryseosolibacter sp.]|nr:RagB/SusD family nutrient uptake outer membrane protein [Chryseosolibacter sp.]
MKKNIITICLAAFGIMVSSCDDLTDRQPLSNLNSDVFWKTEKDAQSALAATYTQYRTNLAGSVPGSNGVSFAIECLSDNAISRSGYFNIQGIMHGGINPQTGGAVQDIWEICYDGIAQCNFFLDNVDQAKSVMTQANYDKYRGEALFNRAYFYNELVQFYGDVPLLISFPKIEDVDALKTQPRVAKATVVEQILQDLDVAIAGLPNVNFTDGHAVRGSAILLKVRVLMNNQRWEDAADAAWTLIGDPANPFRLSSNYAGIFFGDQKGNKEIMFSVQYQAPADAHQLDQYVGSRMSFFPTTQLRNAYEVKDPATGEKDPRLRMTIFQEGDPWVNHVDGIFTTKAAGRLSESGVPFTKLAFKKWINPNLVEARGNISDQHIVKMRYAELLLSYAEAMFESGQGTDPTALAALNAVRQRPGVEMPPVAVLTRDNIRNERRVELAFEGLRYNDLIRWGIAHEILPNIPGNGATVKRAFTMTNYLWPIPQSQMDIMQDVWLQNPGY